MRVSVSTDAPNSSVQVAVTGTSELSGSGTVSGSGTWSRSFAPGPGTYQIRITVSAGSLTAHPSVLTVTV